MRVTFTPSDSAAYGASPDERSRKPKRVRHMIQNVSGTIATAITVSHDRLTVSPLPMPPMSPSNSQRFSSNQPKKSGVFQPNSSPPARNGVSNLGIPDFCCGDWLTPPPCSPVKMRSLRYRAPKKPRMFITTPEIT